MQCVAPCVFASAHFSSELAVPIISTQLVGDALVEGRESLESLVGATFVFGMRSPAEAARALNLAQSAASHAIAALEARHDTKLFDRIGGVVRADRL